MKQQYSLSWLFSVLFIFLSVTGYTQITTIADGNVSNDYIPVSGRFANMQQHQQVIYPASMLSDLTGGAIFSMTFYLNGLPAASWNCTFTVRLGITGQNLFQNTVFIPTDNTVVVYSGLLPINASTGQMTINFTTPFVYTGGNLLLDVQNTTGGTNSVASFYGIDNSSSSLYSYIIMNNPWGPFRQSFIPKTTFTFTGGASCLTPTDFNVDEVDATSVTLSWHARSENAQYQVCCVTAGTDITNVEWTLVSDTMVTFNNLISNVIYTAYVRSYCGAEVSGYTSISFHTECGGAITDFPWTEDFETSWNLCHAFGQENSAPQCWEIYNGGTTEHTYGDGSFYWKVNQNPNQVHSGQHSAVCFTEYATGRHNDWLISPMMSLTGNQRVSFFAQNHVNNTTLTDEISVWISDENVQLQAPTNDTAALPGFTQLFQTEIPVGDFQNFKVSMAGYSGNRYIAFVRRNSPNGGWNLCLDDVTVENIPPCETPTALNAIPSAYNAQLSWHAESNSYNLYYKTAADATYNTIQEISLNNEGYYLLTDLVPGTTYEWYVEAICNNQSVMSSVTATFNTSCGALRSVPQEWDFDHNMPSGTTSYPLPACWEREENQNYPYVYYNQNAAYSGNASLFCNGNVANGVVFLPVIDTNYLSINSLQLRFFAKALVDSSSMEIGIMTNPLDMTTFEHVQFIQAMTDEYEEYKVTFAHVSTTGAYIVIRMNPNGGNLYLDDLVLEEIPACDRPVNLQVSNVTSNSAHLHWSSAVAETNIYYKEESHGGYERTNDSPVFATSYTLHNLSPNTHYTVYVSSVCQDSTEIASSAISFTTECIAIDTIPYIWDFESNNTSGTAAYPMPECWHILNTSAPSLYVSNVAVIAHGGTHSLYSVYPDGALAVLPAINTQVLPWSALQLGFYAKNNYGRGTILEVGVMSDATDESSFESLASFNLTTTYQRFEVSLARYHGNGTYLAFRMTANLEYVVIDDVVLEAAPSCPKPMEVSCIGTGTDYVDLTWTPGGIESNWDVVYGIQGFNPDTVTNILHTNSNHLLIDGLNDTITYDFYVRAACGGNEHSGWQGLFAVLPGSYNMRFMGTDTLYTCGATIYDNGGANGSYSENCESYLVIYPAEEHAFVEINGTLVTESAMWDYLIVYDGVGTSHELFRSTNENSSVEIIPTITSHTGPLTIYFHSDGSASMDGFVIYTTCVTCVPPVLSVSTLGLDSVTLSWEHMGPTNASYELVYGPEGINPDSTQAIILANTHSYTISNLTPDTILDVYVRALCDTQSHSNWAYMKVSTIPYSPATLPYSCDFEDGGENSKWSIENGAQINKWHINSAVNNTANGDSALYVSKDNGLTNTYKVDSAASRVWAYRDFLFPDGDEFLLSFDWRAYGEGSNAYLYDYLSVYIGNPVNVNTLEEGVPEGLVLLDHLCKNSAWSNADYLLGSEYANSTKRLFFVWTNDNNEGENPPAAVDNISLREITCFQTANVSVSEITSTSAAVTIVTEGNIAAWQLKTDSSIVTITDTTTYVLTGLNPATLYEFCVRTICENGDSSRWTPWYSFTTECQLISLSDLPYSCDFEQNNWGGSQDYPLPVCWNRTGGSADYPYSYSSDYYSYSGTYSLYSGEDPTDYIVVLPKLNPAELAANTMQVNLAAKVIGYEDYTYLFEVGVMSDANDMQTFVPVDTINTLTSEYQLFELFLDAYSGQGSYIAFRLNARGNYVYNNYYAAASIYIDDVVLRKMPTCRRPLNLVNTSVNTSSVTVSWTPGANENTWDVAVGERGFNPDVAGTIHHTGTNSLVIENLTASTMYDVYVRANCGSNEHSDWRGPLMVIAGAYTMSTSGTDTIHACGIMVYDDGGPMDNYSGNCDAYLVIYPDEPNSFVEVSGTLIAEHYYYDYLVIYDGVGTDNELFHSNQTDDTITIPSLISTTGPVTIYFHSDYEVNYSGFELAVSCVTCLPPVASVSSIYVDSAVVSWTCRSPSVYNYELVYGPTGFVPDAGNAIVLDTNTTSYALTNLIMDFTYDVYVRTNCMDGSTSPWSNVTTFATYPSMPATVPYSCDFESSGERSSWTIVNNGQTNKWYMNQLEGSTVLYVSGDGGQTNTYVHSAASSSVWAYRDIILPAQSQCVLSFDWRCRGEAMSGMVYDYLKVFIGDPVQVTSGSYERPEGAVEIDVLNMQNTWTRAYYALGQEYAGTVKRLYFLWRNDYSEGEDPAAAIDNIAIDITTCVSPVSLVVSNITTNSATVSIVPESSNLTAWQLLYNNEIVTVSGDTTTVLTALTPATVYEVAVRSICSDGDTSLWSPTVSFITECSVIDSSSLPFTCDFERNNIGGSEFYPLPICWQRTGTSERPYVEDFPSIAHSGNHYLTSGEDAADFCVILPEINTNELPINELQLSFYAKIADFSGSIDVGVMTDPTNIMTFTPLSTISALTTDFAEFEVSLSNYTGNGSYIAIRMNSVGGYYYGTYMYATIYIDDITLNYIPDCQQPANLNYNNLTSHSVSLSWTDVADSYVLYYRAEGESVYNQVNNVTLTNGSYILSGLTAATTYEWYVASVCATGNTAPSHVTGSFTTMCETVNAFPYQESFENGLGCWQSSVIMGENWQWQTESMYNGDNSHSVNAADGNFYAKAYYPSRGNILRLSSPFFNLSSVQEPYVKFQHIQLDWVGDQDYLKIYYKTSPEAEPVLLVSYETPIFPWQLDSLALPNPSANYQLLFDAYLNWGYGVGVDNVIVYDNHVVEEPPVELPVVVTNAASDITETSAILHGTITDYGNQTITLRGFEWKQTSAGTYTQVVDTGTTANITYALTSLADSTSYTYRAFVSTADTTVYGAEEQFTTMEEIEVVPCETPTNLQVSNISATSAEVSWMAGGEESAWVVEHKLQSESEWQTQSVSVPQVTLTDLVSSSVYQVRVKAVCTEDDESDYIDTAFTTSVGINDRCNWVSQIVLMPNPADNHIEIHVNSNVKVDKVEIYNAMGQLVKTVQLHNQQANISLENMSAGMYFVRVYSDRSVVTKKFIKR